MTIMVHTAIRLGSWLYEKILHLMEKIWSLYTYVFYLSNTDIKVLYQQHRNITFKRCLLSMDECLFYYIGFFLIHN